MRELRFKLASEPAVPFDVDKSRGEESFPFFFFPFRFFSLVKVTKWLHIPEDAKVL